MAEIPALVIVANSFSFALEDYASAEIWEWVVAWRPCWERVFFCLLGLLNEVFVFVLMFFSGFSKASKVFFLFKGFSRVCSKVFLAPFWGIFDFFLGF